MMAKAPWGIFRICSQNSGFSDTFQEHKIFRVLEKLKKKFRDFPQILGKNLEQKERIEMEEIKKKDKKKLRGKVHKGNSRIFLVGPWNYKNTPTNELEFYEILNGVRWPLEGFSYKISSNSKVFRYIN